MQRRGREVWTKGLPLLSSRPPPLPSPSSPRLIIHSRHGEPRESRSSPFLLFFFFYWMGLGEPRKTLSSLRRARVVLILSGGLPLLLHCRSTFTFSSSPSFLRQIASFRLTSFRGTRIASTSSSHDDCLPRYLFLSLFPDS